MKRIQNKKVLLPNLFTMINMFCGFFAIVVIVKENYVVGSWLIIAASIFDFLDGKIARSLNTGSKFGIEFDSLADLTSFGIGPSILIYTIYFNQLGNLGIFLSFIPLACGAFRLARFNITPIAKKKDVYQGLPIPLYAITIASFVIINFEYWDIMRFNILFIPMIFLLSILMVSNVKYDKIPKLKITRDKKNNIKLFLFYIFLSVVFLFKGKVLFPLMVIIIFHGIIRWVINLAKSDKSDEAVDVSSYE